MLVRALSFGALLVAALAGCAPAAPVAQTELPDGISIAVFQNRTDFGPRKLEIAVTNDTERAFIIESIEFSSDRFIAPAVWTRGEATIRPGVTTNLPVQLAPANCEAEDAAPLVSLTYRWPGGDTVAAEVEPTDRFDRLDPLFAEDCFAERAAAVAMITADDLPRVTAVGDIRVAELEVTIEPTSAVGELTLDSVGNTTLVQAADPATGVAASNVPLGVDATVPSTVTLTLIPARCDPHAIAEDKRGTIIPFAATLNGTAGFIYVTTPEPVKLALVDFVNESCGRGA